ncbi:MobQ family relaxase [Pseudomonas sp.]|uniref:MobQ family relaxase n=2 Tax=Pseudomonas TaxID=286 RepID=UPI0030810ECB
MHSHTLKEEKGALTQTTFAGGRRCRQIKNRSQANRESKTVALYSVSVKPVSRSSGRSATAAAAYRNAERIIDMRTGDIHDYTRRSGVDHVESFAPVGMAPQSGSELWNKAEAAEVRKNARVAREVLVALPHELDQVQRRELAKSIAQGLADRYGTAGTLAVHQPDREGDNRNHHVHILMTTRRLDTSGQLGEKTRELDDVKRGPQEVEWIRTMIEERTNQSLERAGVEARVDRRSLIEQRAAALDAGDMDRAAELDRPATLHEGPRVTQIRRESARKGRAPLGALDRAAANDHTRELVTNRAELGMVSAQIFNFEKARAERAAREQVAKTAADGMAAFKARFQQNQDFNARIDAERERMANELHRVALERAALERQEQAKAALTRFEKDQLSHDKGPSKGRGGPDFGM